MKMNWFRRLLAEEKGAVLVIVAIGMAAFLGFTALVTDVGLLQLNRASLVNSADAAVLAGVQELPDNVVKAKNEAEKYLSLNNPGHKYEVFFSENNYRIDVRVTKEVNLVFARFLGFNLSEIGAHSAAGIGSVVGYQGIVPFGITENQLAQAKIDNSLKVGAGDGTSGNYGILALSGGGKNSFREITKDGYSEMVRVGDEIPLETGNAPGPVSQGVSDRIDRCIQLHGGTCTVANPVSGCPRILIVPIYQTVENNKKQANHIKVLGFAAFYAAEKPNKGVIVGKFLNIIVPGEIGVGVVNNYGTLTTRLIK
ncbi:MAG: Tad domain-containing protein [Clostridia bacterium]|nr:Tad domain-containing protein [Clostridia bacterium]